MKKRGFSAWRLPRPTILILFLTLALAAAGNVRQAAAQGPDPSVVGQWSAVMPWPIVAVHAHVLPTGKVMFWPYVDDPRLWDPITNTITALPLAGYNTFCSGHALMADGKLIIFGGHVENGWGLPNASLYDPFTNTRTQLPNMNNGRWYPTGLTLPDGEVLVITGTQDLNFTYNTLPQVWTGKGWRDLTGATSTLSLYPHMHVAPNGQAFLAGPDEMTQYLDTSGTGAWTFVAKRQYANRDYGSSVMYETGKVVIIGGGDPSTRTAEVIDLNAPTPAWRFVGSMASPRRQLNATVLPDGKVLVTGGVNGTGFNDTTAPVLAAEMWDPATENFTPLASMAVGRWYHSTAVLLPDGRVLSAGGDVVAGSTNTAPSAEIYSPPYLFKGARPAISSAPANVNYGQTYFVGTPDAASIARVTWVRLSSVTHARNMNQRFDTLAFAPAAGGLSVTAPPNANVCPPGHYMLFLLNSSGVPSVASIVHIEAPSPTPPATPTNLMAADGNAHVSLTWVASTGVTSYNVKRATVSGGPYATIASNIAAAAYSDQGLTNGTPYYYVVSALNAAGESANSAQASATPVAPPLPPTNVTATAGSGQVNLTWAASAGATSYTVRRSTLSGGPYTAIKSGLLATSYVDQGLASTTYYYVVQAASKGGTSSYSAQVSATLGASPPAPTGVSASGSNARVNLAWAASAGATSYNVLRSTVSGGPYSPAGSGIAGTSYVDQGLTNGTTYYYVVQAVNASGTSPNSAQVSATPVAPPAAPTNVKAATGTGSGQVSLSWSASAGATSYIVRRSTVSGGPYTAIKSGLLVTSYVDQALAGGTTYYYVVQAANKGGTSPNSAQVSATPTP